MTTESNFANLHTRNSLPCSANASHTLPKVSDAASCRSANVNQSPRFSRHQTDQVLHCWSRTGVARLIPPLMGEHDLVALRICAHGKVRRLVGRVFGFTENESAAAPQRVTGCKEIVYLKTQTGPGAFALAAPVNAEQRSGDVQLGHDIGSAHDLRVEDLAIESHCTLHLFCPNDIFQFLDLHEAPIAGTICFGNSAERLRKWFESSSS